MSMGKVLPGPQILLLFQCALIAQRENQLLHLLPFIHIVLSSFIMQSGLLIITPNENLCHLEDYYLRSDCGIMSSICDGIQLVFALGILKERDFRW